MEVSVDETTKRSIAVEGALAKLILTLVTDNNLAPKPAREILEMLSLSSETTKEQLNKSIRLIEKIENLKK